MEQRFPGEVPDFHDAPVASNRFILNAAPLSPIVSACANRQTRRPFSKAPTVHYRPMFLSLPLGDPVSANLVPAVNDRPIEWRTCRPDRIYLLLQNLFRSPAVSCRSSKHPKPEACLSDTSALLSWLKTRDIDLRHHPCPKPRHTTDARYIQRELPVFARLLQKIPVRENLSLLSQPVSETG